MLCPTNIESYAKTILYWEIRRYLTKTLAQLTFINDKSINQGIKALLCHLGIWGRKEVGVKLNT
jgi:hypothetical protein